MQSPDLPEPGASGAALSSASAPASGHHGTMGWCSQGAVRATSFHSLSHFRREKHTPMLCASPTPKTMQQRGSDITQQGTRHPVDPASAGWLAPQPSTRSLVLTLKSLSAPPLPSIIGLLGCMTPASNILHPPWPGHLLVLSLGPKSSFRPVL